MAQAITSQTITSCTVRTASQPSEHSMDPALRESSSSWSIRQVRRQAAIARDRTHVEQRFDALEKNVTLMSGKIDEVLRLMVSSPPGLAAQSYDDTSESSNLVNDLAGRVQRMELLLLRTSLKDFDTLDRETSKMLPTSVPSVTLEKLMVQEELETEMTPEK